MLGRPKRLISVGAIAVGIGFVVGLADPCHAQWADRVKRFVTGSSAKPHPSVVQVVAPEHGAIARGSGTLIHNDSQFGYVITNWHVVRSATGDVTVIFPSGYQSLARVLKTDKDWDLALLVIWRGQESAMPLASVSPQPGEPLTIAGYGQEGKYRAEQGLFTTYASPEPGMPWEMFEVSVAARQGDSGGPIMNSRGELSGVLFGAGDGRTTGTQIHRVREFVDNAFEELRRNPAEGSPLQLADAGEPPMASIDPPVASMPSAAGMPGSQGPNAARAMGSTAVAAGLNGAGSMAAGAAGSDWRQSAGAMPNTYMPSNRAVMSPNGTGMSSAHSVEPHMDGFARSPAPEDSHWQTEPSGAGYGAPTFETGASPTAVASANVAPPDRYRGATPEWENAPATAGQPEDSYSQGNALPPHVAIGADSTSPLRSPSRRPSEGVTWDQVRSLLAAFGVFSIMNSFSKALFGPRKSK